MSYRFPKPLYHKCWFKVPIFKPKGSYTHWLTQIKKKLLGFFVTKIIIFSKKGKAKEFWFSVAQIFINLGILIKNVQNRLNSNE